MSKALPPWVKPTLLQHTVRACTAALSENQADIDRAHDFFEKNRVNPELAQYLALVFGSGAGGPSDDARLAAGANLRGRIEAYFDTWPPPVQYTMRQTLISAVSHPKERIRVLAANLVATVVRRGTLPAWRDLLPGLVYQLSTSKEAPAVMGASLCLRLVVEDATPAVTRFPGFDRMVLPVILRFVPHPSEFIRSDMLQCLRHFAAAVVPLRMQLPGVMKAIMPLRGDKSVRVRRQLCLTVRQIVDSLVNPLFDQIPKVVQYFMQACGDADDSVAAEALQVWPSLANKIRFELDDPATGAIGKVESRGMQLLRLLVSQFKTLMPLLIRKLALTEDIIEERRVPSDTDKPDAGTPDRDQDIRWASRKSHYGHAKLAPSAKKAAGDAGAGGSDVPDLGGADTQYIDHGAATVAEQEDSGRVDDQKMNSYFRGRDAAIEAIGYLSEIAETEVVASTMPIVAQLVKAEGPENTLKREAAFTCITAIASRNPVAFEQHITRLEPVLLQGLQDRSPCVRAAAANSCCELMQVMGAYRATLDKVVPLVVRLAGDGYKYVYTDALRCLIGCFDRLAGDAAHLSARAATAIAALVPRCQMISRRMSVDVLTAITHSCADGSVGQPWVRDVANAVIEQWKGIPVGGCDVDHPMMVPVLEAYTALLSVMESNIAPLRPDITFPRLVRIAQMVITLSREAEEKRSASPSVDPAVMSMDAIEVVLGAAKDKADGLVASNSSLLATLSEVLKDRNTDLLNSAARLVGTIASAAPRQLRGGLPPLCMRLTRLLVVDYPEVCQNASWALGEMAAAFGADMGEGIGPICERVVRLLAKPAPDERSAVDKLLSHHRSAVKLNLACLLGRIGLAHADKVVRIMPHIGTAWCISLLSIAHDDDSIENLQSLRGFRNVLQACGSKAATFRKEAMYVAGFLSKVGAAPAMVKECQGIIDVYKTGDPGGWPAFVASLPKELPRVFKVMSASRSLRL